MTDAAARFVYRVVEAIRTGGISTIKSSDVRRVQNHYGCCDNLVARGHLSNCIVFKSGLVNRVPDFY